MKQLLSQKVINYFFKLYLVCKIPKPIECFPLSKVTSIGLQQRKITIEQVKQFLNKVNIFTTTYSIEVNNISTQPHTHYTCSSWIKKTIGCFWNDSFVLVRHEVIRKSFSEVLNSVCKSAVRTDHKHDMFDFQ